MGQPESSGQLRALDAREHNSFNLVFGRPGDVRVAYAREDRPEVEVERLPGAGTFVLTNDRLGSVDMLGIPQEVVAPSDGVVGASLVEPGDAVEYGQDLILIEFASASAPEA